MSNFLAHRRERQLLRAGLTFRKGRSRVLWLHGVLYFGGTLFVLFNAIDYFAEPKARPTPVETFSFFAALALCALAGYIYGLFMWRNLERTFGGR